MPTKAHAPGPLLVIGGAEDKVGTRTILSRFVALAGRRQARIAILSTASSLGNSATAAYASVFHDLGVDDLRGLRPLTREEANAPDVADAVADATGVFMTGGNQLRLATVVGGTALGDAIRDAHARGAVIGGTSAGASAVSTHMVAFGTSGATPKQRMVSMAEGLGLLPGVIIDQHFEQRTRIGRLLALVASSPASLGIGVDEDTAALVNGDVLEVIGRGAVTIVDGSAAESDAYEVRGTRPLMLSGAVLHVLPAGHRFSLGERRLLADDRHADEGAAVELDHHLIRQLAAEGADDTSIARAARRRAHRAEHIATD